MTVSPKVAVVTGASRGIGAGIVRSFREAGTCVVTSSRTALPIATDGGHGLMHVAGDIADPSVADAIVDTALRHFGRIDTLVNNAGIFIPKAFQDYTDEDFALLLGTNLAGFFHLSQRVIAPMLAQGSGHIINITATIASQPMAAVPSALTALTKGGLNAVTRSLAIEYAQARIRVNAVSPGIIQTPMHQPAAHPALSCLQPMGRMGNVQEVVDAVNYLDAASFVTGEILYVDGGAHAGHW